MSVHTDGRRRAGWRQAPVFLLAIGLMAFAGLAALPFRSGSLVASAAARSNARPNILWFIADDASPYLGAYGDPVARTPTIDGLAAQGIRYDTAYSDSPACAPSRFTLITGLYSATAGPAHHMRATATLSALVRGWPELLRRAGYYTINNSKTDYNANIDADATWDDSSPQAHWRNRPAGAPFFAQFTTLTTHESSIFATRPGQTSPDEVSIPAFYPDTPTTRTDLAQYYDRVAQMDGELAQRLSEPEADGLADDTLRRQRRRPALEQAVRQRPWTAGAIDRPHPRQVGTAGAGTSRLGGRSTGGLRRLRADRALTRRSSRARLHAGLAVPRPISTQEVLRVRSA